MSFYQDPVFNIKTGKICERFFCEDLYDEVPNFKNNMMVHPDYFKPTYKKDWEDSPKFFENDFLIFDKNSFEKLETIFINDDSKTVYIIKKLNTFLEKCVSENKKSQLQFELGSKLIDNISKFNCVRSLSLILDSYKDFYENCQESWENFFLNSSSDLIKIVLNKYHNIFFKVSQFFLRKIIEDKVKTNFLKNFYDYYLILNEKGFNIFPYFSWICADIETFGIVFESFIINCSYIDRENIFFITMISYLVRPNTSFVTVCKFVKKINEYDINRNFLLIVFETISKVEKGLVLNFFYDSEEILTSLKSLTDLLTFYGV